MVMSSRTLRTRHVLGFLSVLPLVDEKTVERRAETISQTSLKLCTYRMNKYIITFMPYYDDEIMDSGESAFSAFCKLSATLHNY